MLWRSSDLSRYHIEATDGPIGRVNDLLFDNTSWTLRWAVIDTAVWLPGRRVLLPPAVFGQPDAARHRFPVNVTREQVEKSPGVETDAPLSRQMEVWLHSYYGWTPYWGAGILAPIGPAAAFMPLVGVDGAGQEPHKPHGDPHLHSVTDVVGYHVEASDGRIGQVQEFLVEDASWAIRYAVIDAKTWWPGGLVLVAPQWITDINWSERKIRVNQTRAQVKESPEYHPHEAVTREFEKRLFDAYGANPYWML